MVYEEWDPGGRCDPDSILAGGGRSKGKKMREGFAHWPREHSFLFF
jgi:hypothetical protein